MNKSKTEEFIKRAKTVHGEKYEYSESKYTNSKTKIKILCKFHNKYFYQTPDSHLKGHDCPQCGNLKIGNKLRNTKEEFIEKAIKIHGDKYGYSSVKYFNNLTKVTIICKEHGIFEQTPGSHLSGNGCPKCGKIIIGNQKRKSKEQFIKEAKSIHEDKYDYSQSEYNNCDTKIKILCKFHNEYFYQIPDSHLRGSGCPKCGELKRSNKQRKTKELFIEQAKLVHGEKYDYSQCNYINARYKIKILCKIHGEFEQNPDNHLSGQGCPQCGNLITNNKLRKSKEEFIKQANIIHKNKFGYSLLNYINNNNKIKIICLKHGIFEQTPASHLSGTGCPKCSTLISSDKLRKSKEQFIEEANLVHDNKYGYSLSNYFDTKTKITIICPIHGKFEQSPHNHLRGHGCPRCALSISKQEQEVIDFLKESGLETKTTSKIIKPKRLDIIVESHNIAIEYDGLHWHSEIRRPNKNYHLNKTFACEKLGIHLIHIFEDEWLYKKEIVKSRLLNLFKLTPNKIFARKTIIKEVTNKESRKFLDNNHIQSNSNSKIRLGLYHNDILVSLMTFGSLRKNLGSDSKENYYELTRFCNLINTNVIGGASKLFKHFVKTYQPKQIISYADRRWSQGKLYETLGFNFVHNSAPNYFYVTQDKRKNRFLFRKDILVKEGFDGNKTEHEIMLERKIYRIYDCGAKKYVINF